MIRTSLFLSVSLLLLALGGCVIYDPGYYGPRYHYYHEGPPGHFRYRHHHGWHGMNEGSGAPDPVFVVEYWDEPFMCMDPASVDMKGG